MLLVIEMPMMYHDLTCPCWNRYAGSVFFHKFYTLFASLALSPGRPDPTSARPAASPLCSRISPPPPPSTSLSATATATRSKQKSSEQNCIIPFISDFFVKLPARGNTSPAAIFYIWKAFADTKFYSKQDAFNRRHSARHVAKLIFRTP